MKCSVAWLAELAGTSFNADELAERFTAAGLEVDRVLPVQAEFNDVVVARIIDCKPHPQADKLQLCSVDDGGDEAVQIVCGAPNARPGLVAPLARVGALLPGAVHIKQARLRGEPSYGMLCSASELGLDDDAAGLMALPETASPGTSLVDWLQLDDQIIDIDLTPNRADCLSMLGLLRETAALYEFSAPPLPDPQVVINSNASMACSVADAPACPFYALRMVTGIDNQATTPTWMTERLRRAGLRSKSPVVDVTNYVLLEYGQPLHAFAADKLPADSPGLHVRRARANERMTLLNGTELEMPADYLLITAADQPVALAGIMGSADSAVDANTTDVVLESAWFAPSVIIGKTRDLGIGSEAAHRFERGIDPHIQRLALDRATELLQQIAGGEAGPVTVAASPEHLPQQHSISLRVERVTRLLGTVIDDQRIIALLRSLDMQVEHDPDQHEFQVTPPTARLDLAQEIDLIEEVARLYGYDRLPAADPAGQLRLPGLPEAIISLRRWQTMCADLGYREVMNYSFIQPSRLQMCYPQREPVALANPISSDLSHMRTGLIPGLLMSLQDNLNNKRGRYRDSVRLFEAGTVFNAEDGVQEQQHLALLATGMAMPEQWGSASRTLDFYDFKGDIEHLLSLNTHRFSFQPCANYPFLHPGQAAEVYKKVAGERVFAGVVGKLHPRLCRQQELPNACYVAELKTSVVAESKLPKAENVSKYPKIRRDLALIVPESLSASELLQAMRRLGGDLLKDLSIFDVYHGPGIESDHKSLAIGLILQDSYRTLTDDRADDLIADILQGLERQYQVRLRQT